MQVISGKIEVGIEKCLQHFSIPNQINLNRRSIVANSNLSNNNPTLQFTTLKDFPNYEISLNGAIRHKVSKQIKSQYIGSTGYWMVSLWMNNRSYPQRVHRLLAITFLSNPDALPEVNHKDGNKLNYSIENLEWTTHDGNMKHAFKTGLANNTGENNGQSILSAEKVREIKQLKGKLSQYKIADKFGVSRSCIQGIFGGRLWKHIQ